MIIRIIVSEGLSNKDWSRMKYFKKGLQERPQVGNMRQESKLNDLHVKSETES